MLVTTAYYLVLIFLFRVSPIDILVSINVSCQYLGINGFVLSVW